MKKKCKTCNKIIDEKALEQQRKECTKCRISKFLNNKKIAKQTETDSHHKLTKDELIETLTAIRSESLLQKERSDQRIRELESDITVIKDQFKLFIIGYNNLVAGNQSVEIKKDDEVDKEEVIEKSNSPVKSPSPLPPKKVTVVEEKNVSSSFKLKKLDQQQIPNSPVNNPVLSKSPPKKATVNKSPPKREIINQPIINKSPPKKVTVNQLTVNKSLPKKETVVITPHPPLPPKKYDDFKSLALSDLL